MSEQPTSCQCGRDLVAQHFKGAVYVVVCTGCGEFGNECRCNPLPLLMDGESCVIWIGSEGELFDPAEWPAEPTLVTPWKITAEP